MKKVPEPRFNDVADAIGNINAPVNDKDIKKISKLVGNISTIEDEEINEFDASESDKLSNHEIDLSKPPKISSIEQVNIYKISAAPSDWNLWDPQDDKTKAGLVNSIFELGMLQDIILWKVPENMKKFIKSECDFMLLAGHNRVDANKILHHIFKYDRFENIRAKIFESDVINLKLAKKIIDATNLWSRVKSDKEIGMAYIRDFKTLSESKDFANQSARKIEEELARRNERSRTYIREKMSMANCIDDVANLVGTHINYKAALRLSGFDKSTQDYIYQTYYVDKVNRHLFNNDTVRKLKTAMVRDAIDQVFTSHNKIDHSLIDVTYHVHSSLKQSLDKVVKEFIEANKNII
ncbi:MAG: hypothetical protein JEZ08_22550 [Clostridiales bacterium]|nr:hypothetical protein [Clostridiales bacterium]